MALQDITVRVKAEIASFKRDMAAAADAAKKTAESTKKAGEAAEDAGRRSESGISKLGDIANKHEQAWSQATTGMLAAGTALTAGLGLSAKAAMEWESAWTGVTKTVDGTPAQLQDIEDGLRGLAKELPSTHTEIAGVAEAAGQLGVARDDIVGFTKTMIDLGESTNLTAEDAATNIAQISNVMGTMEREGSEGAARFGAALVALGNDGASTEAEILSMAQRIAGAAATLGASESDVLALSNTLASMGVKAELGGGVASRVLLKMSSAVDEGGDSLQAFAKVAGVSMDQFTKSFRDDPVAALDMVAKGINTVNQEGGNVTATLKELGIRGTEETQVMLALANSGNLLTDSLELGARAWEENSALTDEASKRYETAESRIQMAWNTIKDAAITAGGAILPVIAEVADGVAGAVEVFASLPEPVQQGVAVLGGVAGVALLGAGALGKLIPQVTSTIGGLKALKGALGLGKTTQTFIGPLTQAEAALEKTNKASGRLARGARALGRTAYGVGAAAAALSLFGHASTRLDPTTVQDMADAMTQLSGVGKDTKLDQVFSQWDRSIFDTTEGLQGLDEAVAKVVNPPTGQALNSWADEAFAWTGLAQSDVTQTTDKLAELGDSMGSLVDSGDADTAAAAFTRVAEAFAKSGQGADVALQSVPGYAAALDRIAEKAGVTITEQERLEWALSGVAPAAVTAAQGTDEASGAIAELGGEAEATAESLDDILESMFELGRSTRSIIESQDALTSSLTALDEAVAKNGSSFKGNSEEAMANRAALLAVATEMETLIEAQARGGASSEEIQSTMRSTYDAMMEATGGSDELVRSLLSIPPGVDIDTWMSEQAQLVAQSTAEAIEAIPGHTKVTVAVSEDGTVGQVQEKINGVTGKTEYVFVTDDGTIRNVQQGIVNIDGVERTVWVDDNGTVYSTQGEINGIRGKDVTITADAATNSAERDLNHTARNRTSYVTQTVSIKRRITESIRQIDNGPITGQFGRAKGGRVGLPGLADGGRIPATGLGTDKVMGIDALGTPIVRVDDREWVINRGSSDRYDRELAMINAGTFPKLPGFADGGRPGGAAAFPSVASAAAVSTAQLQAPVVQVAPSLTIEVKQMTVRNESDIRRVSQELFKLSARNGRQNGEISLKGATS